MLLTQQCTIVLCVRGGAGRQAAGVGGFTLGSFDLCLLPFDPDAEELACVPVPRDPDPLRTAAAQGCQLPKLKTRSVTRAQKHARAQAFTNHAQLVCASQLWYPWRQEIHNAGAQATYDLLVSSVTPASVLNAHKLVGGATHVVMMKHLHDAPSPGQVGERSGHARRGRS
jgi:hypothetical protein